MSQFNDKSSPTSPPWDVADGDTCPRLVALFRLDGFVDYRSV